MSPRDDHPSHDEVWGSGHIGGSGQLSDLPTLTCDELISTNECVFALLHVLVLCSSTYVIVLRWEPRREQAEMQKCKPRKLK